MKLSSLSPIKKGNSNRKRFLRCLSKYLLLSCVASLLFIPIYIVALNATKQNVIHEVYRGFESGLTRTSGILNNLISLSDAIIDEQDTKRLSNIQGEMSPRDYMSLMKAQTFMLNVLASDNTVKNAYILFKNNPIFLSKTLTSPDRQLIYNDYYEIEGCSKEAWTDMVLSAHGRFDFLTAYRANWTFVPGQNQVQEDTIHIAVPSTGQSALTVKSVTVFILDYQEFFSCFASDEVLADSFIYLTDRTGTKILDKNYSENPLLLDKEISQQTVNHTSYTVMRTVNPELGLTAVMGIPENYFAERVSSVWQFIILYAMLIILVSILTSVTLAYYQYSPFKKMMDSIQKVISFPPDEKNEYNYISNTIISLDSQSKRYEKELSLMKTSIGSNLLDRMLNGRIHTLEDEEKCMNIFHFISENFLVCIMRIEETVENGQELDITTRVNGVIREQLEADFDFPICFYNGETLKTSIIFNLPEESSSDLGAFYTSLDKMTGAVRETCGAEIIFGIGTIAYGIRQVGVSCTNAQDALRLSHKNEPVHTWYDRKKSRDSMFLGNKAAQRLYEILLIGDPRYFEEDFRQLLKSLAKPCLLSETDISQAFYVLRNTLESASYDILNADETLCLPEYSKELCVLDLFSSFYEPCIELCNHKIIRQSEEDFKQKNEMIDFIKNNYQDSRLCALSIGNKFYVSEKYVFTLVKSHTGKSLGEFIEQLRFTKVEELLETSVDINEIPAMVGFNSVNTFYKAFKRKYGVSPGKWRSMIQKAGNSTVEEL